MKFQLFLLCCILQSIYGFNISDFINIASTRIVGGEDAKEGAAPFQCSIQVNRRHFCGCSIISSEWILTAGHCVAGQSTRSLEILVGTNDLNNGGTYYKTEKIIEHELHDQPRFANDVGLVRVKGKVKPIAFSKKEVPDGAEVQLTGWGRLSGGGAIPNRLQIIRLKIVQTERCKGIVGNEVSDSHICTFTRAGEGACNGDSGGPLVFENEVVGIVNFGVPCALGYPDAYAKVSFLYDWIKKHTAK